MRGLGLVFYGEEGVGKTSLALQFKKDLLCISARENGFENLDMVGDVPEGCENFVVDTFPEIINTLKKAKDYETIVIDSLSGVQMLMANDIIKTIYGQMDNPEKAFGSFSEGYRVHGPMWMERLCNELTLLNERGVNTIILGHAREETVKNVFGTDYNGTVLDMEKWPRAVITKWAAAVLYMTLDMDVMVTKSWKGKPTEGKARNPLEEDSDRIMYTTRHPSHSAKNLLNLPPYISMGESPQEAYKKLYDKLPPKLQAYQAEPTV